MSVGVRLAGFVLALAALFGVGAAVGAAVGPIDVGGDRPHEAPDDGPEVHDDHGG